LYIEPPLLAEFRLKVQSVNVGLQLPALHIPPPFPLAWFPLNVQLLNVGLLPALLYTAAPPFRDALLLKVQLFIVGLPPSLYIPPPHFFGSKGIGGINIVLFKPELDW